MSIDSAHALRVEVARLTKERDEANARADAAEALAEDRRKARDIILGDVHELRESIAAARRILKFALYEEGYCEMTMADEPVAAPLHHAPGCDNGPPHSCDCWVGNAWRAIAAPAPAPGEETKR